MLKPLVRAGIGVAVCTLFAAAMFGATINAQGANQANHTLCVKHGPAPVPDPWEVAHGPAPVPDPWEVAHGPAPVPDPWEVAHGPAPVPDPWELG